MLLSADKQPTPAVDHERAAASTDDIERSGTGAGWTSSTTCVQNGTLLNIIYHNAAQHRSRPVLHDETCVALPRHVLTCKHADPHAVDLAAVDVFSDH